MYWLSLLLFGLVLAQDPEEPTLQEDFDILVRYDEVEEGELPPLPDEAEAAEASDVPLPDEAEVLEAPNARTFTEGALDDRMDYGDGDLENAWLCEEFAYLDIPTQQMVCSQLFQKIFKCKTYYFLNITY